MACPDPPPPDPIDPQDAGSRARRGEPSLPSSLTPPPGATQGLRIVPGLGRDEPTDESARTDEAASGAAPRAQGRYDAPQRPRADDQADRDADDRLIDAALAGYDEAFGTLVRRYQDRLRATLYRVTGSAEEAEDVAQEAFVQALLKLDSFQRSSRFYTWLYRIAFNIAVSRGRKRRPRVSLSVLEESGGADPACDSPAPHEATLRDERGRLLHAAIAELSDDHRQVLVLREFEELDYEQIADALEVPVGTVRSRLFRARAQLRERLVMVLGDP